METPAGAPSGNLCEEAGFYSVLHKVFPVDFWKMRCSKAGGEQQQTTREIVQIQRLLGSLFAGKRAAHWGWELGVGVEPGPGAGYVGGVRAAGTQAKLQ